MKTKSFVLAGLVAAVSACGGGGGSGSDVVSATPPLGNSTGTVSLFVMDDLTTAYSEVWVTIKKVTAVDAAGSHVVVYNDTTGKAVNLTRLNNVGSLLNTIVVPSGNYEHFSVTVNNAIKLINNVGIVTNATFTPTADTWTINVDGKLAVANGQVTSFALDFDLKNFTLNADTAIVTPVVVFRESPTVNALTRQEAEIHGVVQSVNGANEIELLSDDGKTTIRVKVGTSAIVFDRDQNKVATSTTALQPNAKVDVRGSYDSGTLTLTADRVTLDNSTRSSTAHTVEIEGVVQSYTSGALTLDVKDSEFVPVGNTVSVVNVTNASFSNGTLATLQPSGQSIDILGTWDGASFTAQVIKFETAHSADANHATETNSQADVKSVL